MARGKLNEASPLIGRFDQSFLIHMIRDFFVLLLLVTLLEFALKAGTVYFDFRSNGPRQVKEVAESIVANAETQIETSERVFADLGELGDESDKLKGAMAEMIRLEERMAGIVETGSVLVHRIRPPETAAE